MNHCSLGGYLVDGRAPLPADPSEYDVEILPRRGCNHLRCLSCRAVVRNAQGLHLVNSIARIDCSALYELADLAASPVLAPASGFRFYVCRCKRWVQTGHEDALDDPDTDPYPQRSNMPWRCDGHPVLELPHDLDGVLVTPDGLPALIVDALRGAVPPGAHPFDRSGPGWAARMHARLAGTPWADAVDRVATRCLEDPETKVRERALLVAATVPLVTTRLRAVELLERERASFAGAEDAAWRALTPLIGEPGRARELARGEALATGKGRASLYTALAMGDPEWLATHAGDVARATPAEAPALIQTCKQRLAVSVWRVAVDRIQAALAASGGPG